MNNSIDGVGTEHSFSVLLEHAADNDVDSFKCLVCDESEIEVVRLWYGHQRLSRKRVIEHRTPLMVAAQYGSIDVVNLILALPDVDVNFSCGSDKCTALHCATSGGSANSVDIVKLLLLAGADPNISDASGMRPVDVIAVSPNFPSMKIALEELLKNNASFCNSRRSSSPAVSWSSGSILASVNCKPIDAHVKKEYPVDPSFPDIKNSIYTTDEFRMFSFKIQPCSRAYSHDWTECPFAHPGENARRRDPRRFNYSCMPCPDHRKGACRRGDLCEYSHGIFECWLHPAQYRTRLCKDGTGCTRRVCFFAHTPEELRPLYASTDATLPLPQAAVMDFTTALRLLSGSPTAVSALSHFPFTPPMSPSANDIHLSMAWPQQNTTDFPILGNNFQASHPRTSLNGRCIPPEALNRFQDFESQRLHLQNELSCFSQPHYNISSTNVSTHLNPLNLDRLLTSEVLTNQVDATSIFSPYKSAVLNKVQQQSMLSPIKTSVFSPKNVDHPLLQISSDSSSPRIMSPRINKPLSPLGSQLPALAQSEKLQLQLSSLSSREVGTDHMCDFGFNGVNSWSNQKPAIKNVDWSDELGQLQKSSPNLQCGEEPDVSWVQSVLKESSSETEDTSRPLVSGTAESSSPNPLSGSVDQVGLRAWLEGMHLDQIVA